MIKKIFLLVVVIIVSIFLYEYFVKDNSNTGWRPGRERAERPERPSRDERDDSLEIDTSDEPVEIDTSDELEERDTRSPGLLDKPSPDWKNSRSPGLLDKTPSWKNPRYSSRTSSTDDFFAFLIVVSLLIFGWYALFAIPRLIWVIAGRSFGFYKPSDFRLFTKFGLPWRLIYRPIHNLRMWFSTHFLSGKKATAKFSSLLETMSLVYKPNQIFLGRVSLFGIPLFQPVGIDGDTGRHITMIAGTGSGKTTHLMTMLGLHDGNMFVIDCDAQMYNALKRRQGDGGNGILGKGKDVFILDPYNQSGTGVSACWNPIEEIDAAVEQHGENMAVDAAISLSHSLIRIVDTKNEWVYTGAREFMTGLILYVWRYSPPGQRNLLRLRELLTRGLEDDDLAEFDSFEVLIEAMKMKDDFGGKIAEGAASITSKAGDKNYSRESAIDQTSWISIPQIAKTLTHSDFRCRDLKTKDTSLFIVAPITDIRGKLSGWVRAITIMTMEAFQKTPGKPKNPCLFAIDEMPSLGKIDLLVDASAVFRKYKVRLITITQDIEKLRKAYPDEWKGFLGGSECVIWMANEEPETLDFLSRKLGKSTRKAHRGLWSLIRNKPSQNEDRGLMDEEQLSRFLGNDIIVTRYSNRPLKLKHAPYYSELPVYYYEADKNFGDTPRRAYMRERYISKNRFPSKTPLPASEQ